MTVMMRTEVTMTGTTLGLLVTRRLSMSLSCEVKL